MILLTLTNTGENNPDDYVSVNFKLDEETSWMDIVAKLLSQGLPALGYGIPKQPDILMDMLIDKIEM